LTIASAAAAAASSTGLIVKGLGIHTCGAASGRTHSRVIA
jgi:hypothetical protein